MKIITSKKYNEEIIIVDINNTIVYTLKYIISKIKIVFIKF